MSLLRPARSVEGPDGRRWEIYVSRFKPPGWKPSDYDSLADDYGGAFFIGRLLFFFWLIELPIFLVNHVLWPLLRLILTLPWTIVRGLTNPTIRVEAISFFPWEESHLWVTTRDHVGLVVEQVARGL